MDTLANVFDLLADELARLRRWCFTFCRILFGTTHYV
jgi:hypothetical protein